MQCSMYIHVQAGEPPLLTKQLAGRAASKQDALAHSSTR